MGSNVTPKSKPKTLAPPHLTFKATIPEMNFWFAVGLTCGMVGTWLLVNLWPMGLMLR